MSKMTRGKAIAYILKNYDLPNDVREVLEKMLIQLMKKPEKSAS